MPPVDMGAFADDLMDEAERWVPPEVARDAREVRPPLVKNKITGLNWIIRIGSS